LFAGQKVSAKVERDVSGSHQRKMFTLVVVLLHICQTLFEDGTQYDDYGNIPPDAMFDMATDER